MLMLTGNVLIQNPTVFHNASVVLCVIGTPMVMSNCWLYRYNNSWNEANKTTNNEVLWRAAKKFYYFFFFFFFNFFLVYGISIGFVKFTSWGAIAFILS